MRVCKKCRCHNEENSRFCYQCGTKLNQFFSALEPEKKKKSLDLQTTEMIRHPLQKPQEIATRENQGQILSAGLHQAIAKNQAALLKMDPQKEVKPILETVPIPLQLYAKKDSSTVNRANVLPEPTSGKNHFSEIQKPLAEIHKKEEASAQKESVVVKSKEQENFPEVAPSRFLDPEQQIKIRKQIPRKDFSGVVPQVHPFSRKAFVQSQEEKVQKEKEQERKERILQDLAYLDGVDKKEVQREEEEISTPVKIPIRTKSAGKSVRETPESSILDPKVWTESLDKSPKPPSEQLQKYQHGDSAEMITPLVTIVAFIYFCYVLYI